MATELIVTSPFSSGGVSYTVGTLITDAGAVAAVLANAGLRGKVAQIQVSGGAPVTTPTPPAGGGSSTGTTTTTTGTATGGGFTPTAQQLANIAAVPGVVTAEAADASAIGTLGVQVNALGLQRSASDANITSLQQQSAANATTDTSQGARLDADDVRLAADDTEIATLTAQIAALMAGGSGVGSGVAATAYIAVVF